MSDEPSTLPIEPRGVPATTRPKNSPISSIGKWHYYWNKLCNVLTLGQLEELVKCSAQPSQYMGDPIERALTEISSLATGMNEGKREAEGRRKLVQWQARIRGKFPSPLVQPHRYGTSYPPSVFTNLFPRRLIMDGALSLTRVVRKATIAFDVIDSHGDTSTVQVECLAPEMTPRALIGILCNDLLVLCRDPSQGQDPHSPVDLWAVLRMQTLPQPASIVHGNGQSSIVKNRCACD